MKTQIEKLDRLIREIEMDEYLNEETLPKIREAKGLLNTLHEQCNIANVVGQSEQLKAKLDNVSELAKNFIDEVDKKHPFVSLPQDEDFYMARHRLAEKLI